MMNYTNSLIQEITYNKRKYFVKRDDLLDTHFSGNKARKFYYFLKSDLRDIKRIISFGSCQSNSMYSLSVLSKIKNINFDYYVSHIPAFLKNNPSGNYKKALENGMNLKVEDIPCVTNKNEIIISEGGAVKEASFGIKILANEIIEWANNNNFLKLKVFLPSGTGTTALYLQKYLPFEVLTCSCVGDDEYLRNQFLLLEQNWFPTILKKERKYHFGKLYKIFYDKHLELLKQTNIEFDLLYDSLGWIVFEKYVESFENDFSYKFLYIHQGGILGNDSMIERYKFKYNL